MNSLREQVETLRDAVEWLEALDPHTSCNLNVAPDWVPGIPECTCGADQRLDRLYEAIDLIDAHRCDYQEGVMDASEAAVDEWAAHRCLDPERLARALRVTLVERGWFINVSEGTSHEAIAAIIAAAYEDETALLAGRRAAHRP